MTNEERAAEALAHLQAAAHELIAAARAVLDVADDLVDDPGPLFGVLSELAAPFVGRARGPAGPGGTGAGRDGGAPKAPRVQHIRVS